MKIKNNNPLELNNSLKSREEKSQRFVYSFMLVMMGIVSFLIITAIVSSRKSNKEFQQECIDKGGEVTSNGNLCRTYNEKIGKYCEDNRKKTSWKCY